MIICLPKSQAEETNTYYTIAELWDATNKKFNYSTGNLLFETITNTKSGTLEILNSQLSSGNKTASTLRSYTQNKTNAQSILVILAGLEWIVSYISKDTDGNIIATLWLNNAAQDAWTSTLTGSFATFSSRTVSTYPSNMYGSSYVRARYLNMGGKYATSNTALSSYSQSSSHVLAKFTMPSVSGNITEYIVPPSKVSWQLNNQNAKSRLGLGYDFNNDAINAGGNFSDTYNYLTNSSVSTEYYQKWQNDYIWLPSLTETGYGDTSNIGIWQTNEFERTNSTLTRGADYQTAYFVWTMGKTGYGWPQPNTTQNLRPAFHLNLTKLAENISTPVTLDLQGGTGGTTQIRASAEADMPSITIPSKTGYIFSGYFSNTNGGGTQYYTSAGTSATTYPVSGGATTLYAYWVGITYYVQYNGNGATNGSMSLSTFIYGTAHTLASNTYTRKGYTFEGWATSSTGSVVYTNETSITTGLTTINGTNIILYAVWEISPYKIDLVSSNSSLGSVAGGGNYGIGEEISLYALPQTGCAFMYWIDSANPGILLYSNPLKITVVDPATYTAYFSNSLLEGIAVSVEGSEDSELVCVGEARITGYSTTNGLTSVHFSAVPYKNYEFVGWRINGTILSEYKGSSVDIPLELVENKQVFAVFEKITSQVNENVNNT